MLFVGKKILMQRSHLQHHCIFLQGMELGELGFTPGEAGSGSGRWVGRDL